MYDFILLQWRLGKLTEAQIDTLAARGRITAEQAAVIKSTARV